jgi:hypothetical protein
MSISVSVDSPGKHIHPTLSGAQLRHETLTVTGLTAGGANTIPHTLPFTPRKIGLRPGALGLWGETSAPDSSNIYITVGGGGATAGKIDVWE